jgi:hypothetical protein
MWGGMGSLSILVILILAIVPNFGFSEDGRAQQIPDFGDAQPSGITQSNPNSGRFPAGTSSLDLRLPPTTGEILNMDQNTRRIYDQCMASFANSPFNHDKKSSDCLQRTNNVMASLQYQDGMGDPLDHEFSNVEACRAQLSGSQKDQCYYLSYPGKRTHLTQDMQAQKDEYEKCLEDYKNTTPVVGDDAAESPCSHLSGVTRRGGGGGDAVTQPANVTEQKAEDCRNAGLKVSKDCNSEAQSWMKNIQMVSRGVGPIMQQMNPDACGTLAATDVGTSSSLAVFKTMCNTATVECEKACKEVKPPMVASDIEQANATLAECKKKGTKAAEAEQQAAAATGQIMQAVQACQSAFGTGNPFNNMANNPYQGKTAEEIQANLTPTTGEGMTHGGVGGSGSAGGGETGGRGGFSMDFEDEEKPKGAQKMAGPGGGGDIGGAKGGGAPGSKGGMGGGAAGNRRNQSGILNKLGNILSGFFGGKGGGAFGGSGGPRGGSGGGGYGATQAAVQKQPDLRQFMPTTGHKIRGVAGAHGVSGAHGNIWKMINNRYQAKRSTLLPR